MNNGPVFRMIGKKNHVMSLSKNHNSCEVVRSLKYEPTNSVLVIDKRVVCWELYLGVNLFHTEFPPDYFTNSNCFCFYSYIAIQVLSYGPSCHLHIKDFSDCVSWLWTLQSSSFEISHRDKKKCWTWWFQLNIVVKWCNLENNKTSNSWTLNWTYSFAKFGGQVDSEWIGQIFILILKRFLDAEYSNKLIRRRRIIYIETQMYSCSVSC